MKFENTTKIILEDSGWYKNRHIDISTAKDMLADRGYAISQSFDKFYTEFGDLLLTLSVLDNERAISFYLRDSFGIDYDEMVINIYPEAIGCKSLDIIGNVNHNNLLTIDEKSTIYMLYDGTAKIIGKDPIEAIENLCSKDWRWFDQFEYPWKERWNGLKCDFKYVRTKEIENHKNFIAKYGGGII